MNKFAILLLTAIAFLLTNCQKEKLCSNGYTGPDCQEEITPLRISIDGICIVRFPARQKNGQTWDISGNGQPDLFINLYEERSDTKLLNLDYYIENATTSVTFNEPLTFGYPNENHILELMDYDGLLNPHKLAGIRFTPHKEGAKFPSIITYKTTDIEVEFFGAKYNF